MEFVMPDPARAELDISLQILQEACGDADYEAARAEGRALDFSEAVSTVLDG